MKYSKPQEQAFIALLEQHKRLIVKIASVYFQQGERNDVIQEIILHLWKAFPKYDTKQKASTWIYRIALNVSISYFRKEQNRKKKLTNYQQVAGALKWQAPDIEEKLKQLYTMISGLNPIEKAIIILYLEGCKNEEIGEVIGISISNVSTKIHRIKNKLIKNHNAKKRKS